MSAPDEDTAGSQSELEEDENQDEKTLENRRNHLQTVISVIEDHFGKAKHQLYMEKKNLYEIQIKQLKERPDENKDLADGIRALLKEVHDRKDVAAKLKDLHTKAITNWYRAEEQAIKQSLEQKKIEEKNRMRLKFQNKIDEIQDSLRQKNQTPRQTYSFPYANCGRFIKSGNHKIKNRNTPYVVYQLKEELINQDWNFIRKQTRDIPPKLPDDDDGPIIKLTDEFDFF